MQVLNAKYENPSPISRNIVKILPVSVELYNIQIFFFNPRLDIKFHYFPYNFLAAAEKSHENQHFHRFVRRGMDPSPSSELVNGKGK